MTLRGELRDPWVAGGLVLLAVLSALAVLMYRTAPGSVGEARTRVLSSALPNAFTPQLDRARELMGSASAASEAGRDSVALAAYEEAARYAGSAWELARDDAQTASAIALWAEATLRSAEMLLEMGTGPALRPDDDALLGEALDRTQQVISAPVDSTTQERAVELRGRVERQLRPGPLEWLPPWRR